MQSDLSKFSKPAKGLLRAVQLAFTPLAIGFLIYFAWNSQATLLDLLEIAQWHWMLASVILWAALHYVFPVFTTLIFSALGLNLNFRQALGIHTQRLPAKYLPGGIWHSVARASDYQRLGNSTKDVVGYLLIENFMIAASTLLLGGLVVLSIQPLSEFWVLVALTAATIGLVTLLILPLITNRFLVTDNKKMDVSIYLQSIACQTVYWSIVGSSFICFILAFPDLGLTASILQTGGIYVFSWGVGFVSIFAPQGIGISELVTDQLLVSDIKGTSSIAFLASFRLLILIADMLAWMVSFTLKAK